MRCAGSYFRDIEIRVCQVEQFFQTLYIICQMQIGEQRFQSRGTAVLGNGGPLRHVCVYRIACTAIDGLLLLTQAGKDPLHRVALSGGGDVGKRSFAGVGCVGEHQLTANHNLQHRVTQIGQLGGGIGIRTLIIPCIHIHTVSIAFPAPFCKTRGQKCGFLLLRGAGCSLTLCGICAIMIR